MEEGDSDAMNLDLDLGSGSEPTIESITNEVVRGTNEVLRMRPRNRWRWRHLLMPQLEAFHEDLPDPSEPHNISRELNHSSVNFGNGSASQVGEESARAETTQKKDDIEQGIDSYGEFFDCNICLGLAKDPVVTSCGHLFCWRCLFQWLNVPLSFRECPCCKGEVVLNKVTPIYGRGNYAYVSEQESSDPKIPPRPQARRVDNLWQTLERNSFSPLVEEMLQHVGNRNGLTQDLAQPYESTNARHEQAEIDTSLPRMLLTPRGMMNEQMPSQENPPLVDDRDSFSSIDGIINSGSDMETGVEINSMESLSTASSSRNNNTSGVPDVDNEDY